MNASKLKINAMATELLEANIVWYILIVIGIIWFISDCNDKDFADEEIIGEYKACNIKWVNELIESL
jgi:hypothetical protein